MINQNYLAVFNFNLGIKDSIYYNFISGFIKTAAGVIPKVNDYLKPGDLMGAVMVRWAINRNNYRINPGLYAVGSPDENSEVLVSANYKLSFDTLRKHLSGMNTWILVLDTKGINVWCAAGKGTFGTKELVRRIEKTLLDKVIKHKRLIIPQLGAAGVSAHAVKELSGFNVIYGPVRASDIKGFLHSHYKADKEMRLVDFPMYERLKLIPNDFIQNLKYIFYLLVLVVIFSAVGKNGISSHQILPNSLPIMRNILFSYLTGIILTPMLLPYIPVRSFALKGFLLGLFISFILFLNNLLGNNVIQIAAWFVFFPAFASFFAMNFTGASTFTSLSGVKKEMKYAVPLQIASIAVSCILIIIKTII
jgi:hypothetical protein